MSLLTPDVDLSDFWRVRVLLQPTEGTSPSLFSELSLCLTRCFSCLPLASLPVSPADPHVAPFLSSPNNRKTQAANLWLSFVTPQYLNSDWSDLYVHKQVLGAIAIHIPSAQRFNASHPTAQDSSAFKVLPAPPTARTAEDEAKQQASEFRRMLQEEYPTVLVKRVVCLLPPAPGTASATDRATSEEDDELALLPESLWEHLTGSDQRAPVREMQGALEGPLRSFCAALLRQMGALVLRTPDVCRPLVTPLDGALLPSSPSETVGLPPSPVSMGRLPGPPAIPGVQTGAAAGLFRLMASRLQKQTADLLLLGGAPAAAAQLYLAAAEAARAHGDVIWQAAAVQGQAAAVYAYMQPMLREAECASCPSTAPGGNPSNCASGEARAEIDEAAAGAATTLDGTEKESPLYRSNSMPSAPTESSLMKGPSNADPLPPSIEAILLQYQQRRAGAPVGTGGPQGGGLGAPSGVPAVEGSGGKGIPLLQPLSAAGGPYGGAAPKGYGAGEREVDKAHAAQVQLALDAISRKLRDASHAYQSHPGGFLLHACCSLLLCRFLATHGSKLECLQCVSSAAERAKRLPVKDFVCLLGALGGLCGALGAPRKAAFLLHRVCMALMEAQRWEAAHYAAALAAPCYHLAALHLAPPDRLHPLAHRRATLLKGLAGLEQQDACGASSRQTALGSDFAGFCRQSSASLMRAEGPSDALSERAALADKSPSSPRHSASASAQGGLSEKSESPYFPVPSRRRLAEGARGGGSGKSSKARGPFLTSLWRLVHELQTTAHSPDSTRWRAPSRWALRCRGGPPGPLSPGGPSLWAFLLRHAERLRFTNNEVRVAWPALQSRVLHVLKVSAEQLGDFSRVAWYSFASLKLLYPVIDAKAQASAVMVLQAAAGRRATTPLCLPPVLTILMPRAPTDRRGGPLKPNGGGPPGAPKNLNRGTASANRGGASRPGEDKLSYLGEEALEGPPRQRELPCAKRRLFFCCGRGGGRRGGRRGPPPPPAVPLLSPAAPGGTDGSVLSSSISVPPKSANDVLMFNPFRKDVGSGTPARLSPSGLWVRGELRTVQVSVRNPLSVELVLDKAKVIVCGAKAEVYPVTVLVPPSAAHQVTFEVTVMPRETGYLYFTGLSYTLNRVQCCQLLVRQSEKLDGLLSNSNFVGTPSGLFPGMAGGVGGTYLQSNEAAAEKGFSQTERQNCRRGSASDCAAVSFQTSSPSAAVAPETGSYSLESLHAEGGGSRGGSGLLLLPGRKASNALPRCVLPVSVCCSEAVALGKADALRLLLTDVGAVGRRKEKTVLRLPARKMRLGGPHLLRLREPQEKGMQACSLPFRSTPGDTSSRALRQYVALEGRRLGEAVVYFSDSSPSAVAGRSEGEKGGCYAFLGPFEQLQWGAEGEGGCLPAYPRHSPVWEGQHRLLSVHLENVGRIPVGDLSFKVLTPNATEPNPKQKMALERLFQVSQLVVFFESRASFGRLVGCVAVLPRELSFVGSTTATAHMCMSGRDSLHVQLYAFSRQKDGTVEFSPAGFRGEASCEDYLDLNPSLLQSASSGFPSGDASHSLLEGKWKAEASFSSSSYHQEEEGPPLPMSSTGDQSFTGVAVSPFLPPWKAPPEGATVSFDPLPLRGRLPNDGSEKNASEREKTESPASRFEKTPLIQPGQRVRIPLRCIASERYPSCFIE
ncbi:hypothetical protein cyc_05062 [Cyclospora cayetanensis]|uniref:Trs120/TRAPPC9 first Ig-like domain-containing protein n=1 Tax=Cyclospora cayetanensis TaxID=88456 RepID=A0A1D3CUC3_9EIME|nr:hypothetical protein cyc_05062 [Cyclospora cayetanensis]